MQTKSDLQLDSSSGENWKNDWHGNGFFIIRAAIDKKLCADIAEHISKKYDKFIDETTLNGPLPGSRSGHINCSPGDICKKLFNSVRFKNLLLDLFSTVGTQFSLDTVGCNCNLPGSHNQPFHPDSSFHEQCLIVNIALVDTDEINGATELVPKTHKSPLRYHEFVNRRYAARSVRPRLSAGDVVVRSAYVWHRGTRNRSHAMRPMLGLVYRADNSKPNLPILKEFDRFGGPTAFLANRFSATHRGRLEESVQTIFPFLHSSARFLISVADG